MYGTVLRTIFAAIIFFHPPEANSQPQGNLVITYEELKFVIVNKNLLMKLNYFLPTNHQIWVEFVLSKNVTQFKVKLIMDIIKKDNRTVNLMKHDFDGCQLLQMAFTKVRAISLSTAELFRTSNLPKKCPLYANKLYYVRNYTMDEKNYPIIIPAMRWQVVVQFYIGKSLQGKLYIKGEVNK